jgi:hypothetical protein
MRKWIFQNSVLILLIIISNSMLAQIGVLRIDSLSNVTFFQSVSMSYPKWVTKDKHGRWINSQTQKKIHDKDTSALKAPVTSFLMRDAGVNNHTSPDTILSIDSRALLSNDTLFILCNYQSTLSGEIVGISLGATIDAAVMEGYPRKENRIGQKVVFHHLILNKNKYRKGDELRAELDFYIEYDLNDVARGPYKEKVYYKGWMRCKVE